MDALQRGIAALLRSAVTGEQLPLPEGFSLEEAQELIHKQALVTLAYEGAFCCGIDRKAPVMQEMKKAYYRYLLKSERQMQKVNRIVAAFEEQGIDYFPFKGCVMKQLYPQPHLRVMGDADILIRYEQYEKIKPIVKELGFTLKIESDCELIWTCDDLLLELHRRIVQPTHKDYYAYYGDGWQRAKHISDHRYGFTPEDTFVYLFMHFAKHYRSGGIGCRHVLDLWVYRWEFPDLDEAYIRGELQTLRLLEFYENVVRMLSVWFEEQEADNVVRFMTNRIFSGGSWGKAQDYHVFRELIDKTEETGIKNSRMGFVKRLLFPSVSHMQQKYPILEEKPALLPIYWCVRSADFVLRRQDEIKKHIRIGKIITDEALSAHCDALEYVGLHILSEEDNT